VKLYTQLYVYASYSFFNLCTEFHVARMQTKFCSTCRGHTKCQAGWAYTNPTRLSRLSQRCSWSHSSSAM